jgi:2-hydroxychromene-2-carboxylate isomerase
MATTVTIYSDYKSPYAYLAVGPAYQLAEDFGLALEWRPYTLDIPAYLGEAQVDETGAVVHAERNAHQWRRVKYSYMDCRRYAGRQGLTILGPRKIFDSRVVNTATLYAQAQDKLRPFHDMAFERFFRRELEAEDPRAVAALLRETGVDADGFVDYQAGPGRAELERIQREAEGMGVFGVPTFVLDGEIFWGREHLPLIREFLAADA